MKQPKKERAERASTPDRRPSKPEAGEVLRHQAAVPPYSGLAKDDPQRAGAARPASTRPTKPAFEGANQPPPADVGADTDRPDQQAPGVRRAGGPNEQYVRLRIRVRGDRLSVVDSHLVDGPLGQSTTFQGANAYDVTHQDRLLHAGNVQDLGTQRSFPIPDGPPEMRGHHVTQREVFEFAARVPASEVTPETIGGIRVRLHRVDGVATTEQLGPAPLESQFAGRLSPVAELVGLPESALPEAIAARGGRTATGA